MDFLPTTDILQFCPAPDCQIEAWWVIPDPAIDELWVIVSRVQLRSVLVAATRPICPDCGTTLLLAGELTADASDGAEAGPLFAYIRQLG